MIKRREIIIGDEKSFHITVRDAFTGDGGYDVTIWPSNHGTTLSQSIKDPAKAERIARFLYEELLPENARSKELQNQRIREFEEEQKRKPKPKLAIVPKNAPVFEVLICPDCEEPFEEDDIGEAVYECSTCGQKGIGEDGRRCGDCHRFNAKQSDHSCPECEAEIDIDSDIKRTLAKRATDGSIRLITETDILENV